MNTPVWFVTAVATFGTCQWLRLMFQWCADIHNDRLQRRIDSMPVPPPPRLRVINGIKVWEFDDGTVCDSYSPWVEFNVTTYRPMNAEKRPRPR